MAYYSPRPDGLVNVDIGGGRALPMLLEHAQAAGALPMPDVPMVPVANPNSALGPNAFAGAGASDESAIASALANPQPVPAPVSPFQNGKLNIPAGTPLQSGSVSKTDFAQGVQQLQSEAPQTQPDEGGGANGLIAIGGGGAQGGPQGLSPQAMFFGAQGPGHTVQVSKGGDLRTSFVRRPGVAIDESLQQYGEDTNPKDIASKRETLVTNAAIAADNAVQQQIDATKQAEAELEQQRAQVAQNRAVLQQKYDAIEARDREAAAATPQTRSQIIQGRGTLANMMSGLSIALGGWVQGLKGGPNSGLDILNDAVQGEIDTQRARYEAMKSNSAAASTAFGKVMQLYGDPNMAEADMRMRALTLAANMADAYKAQGMNQLELARQQELTRQLHAQAAEEKQKLKTLAEGQIVQENYQYQAPQFVTVGGASAKSKDQREEEEKARERLVRLYNGEYRYATGRAQNVPELQGKLTSAGNFLDTLDKIETRLAKAGPTLSLDDRNAVEALRQQALSQNSKLLGEGVVTEGDAKRNAKYLGDTNAILSDNRSGLRALRSVATDMHNSIVRDYTSKDPYGYVESLPSRSSTFKPGLAE